MAFLSIIVCAFAIVIGIFMISDCDLPLYLLPVPKDGAYKAKVVWITGASSGIGASLALDFAKGGSQVNKVVSPTANQYTLAFY